MGPTVIRRLVVAAGLAVLGIAMVLSTKFLTPEEVEAMRPDQFDPQEAAEELHSQAQTELTADAQELPDVADAILEDPEAAAEEFDAASPSEDVAAYSVEASGEVREAGEDTLILDVDGLEGRDVVIPLGAALDGNLIRDLTGFQFGDAPGQTEYQQVGTNLSTLLREGAVEAAGGEPAALEGEQVTVRGVLSQTDTGGSPSADAPLSVQPLELEVGA